ncbi:MAG TPA: hypothetical protein VK177_07055 [Flavobacteriales bacterium]|nr:hypothetical protein [Flavobacteriales bacterium]
MKMVLKKSSRGLTIIALPAVISFLIAYTVLNGLFLPATDTTPQEFINLFLIVPLLLISSLMAFRRMHFGTLIWGGTLLYIAHVYFRYCFYLLENKIVYEHYAILCLSVYLLIYLAYLLMAAQPVKLSNNALRKVIAWSFLLLPLAFLCLWLLQKAPFLPTFIGIAKPSNTASLTNPYDYVYMLIILPGLFLTGVWLNKNKKPGLLLAPVLLMFFFLTDISLAGTLNILNSKGLYVNPALTLIMCILGLYSIVLLVLMIKKGQPK